MMTEEQYRRFFTWRKRGWYKSADNGYGYELTDAAPEKARESYAEYRKMVDNFQEQLGDMSDEEIRLTDW